MWAPSSPRRPAPVGQAVDRLQRLALGLRQGEFHEFAGREVRFRPGKTSSPGVGDASWSALAGGRPGPPGRIRPAMASSQSNHATSCDSPAGGRGVAAPRRAATAGRGGCDPARRRGRRRAPSAGRRADGRARARSPPPPRAWPRRPRSSPGSRWPPGWSQMPSRLWRQQQRPRRARRRSPTTSRGSGRRPGRRGAQAGPRAVVERGRPPSPPASRPVAARRRAVEQRRECRVGRSVMVAYHAGRGRRTTAAKRPPDPDQGPGARAWPTRTGPSTPPSCCPSPRRAGRPPSRCAPASAAWWPRACSSGDGTGRAARFRATPRGLASLGRHRRAHPARLRPGRRRAGLGRPVAAGGGRRAREPAARPATRCASGCGPSAAPPIQGGLYVSPARLAQGRRSRRRAARHRRRPDAGHHRRAGRRRRTRPPRAGPRAVADRRPRRAATAAFCEPLHARARLPRRDAHPARAPARHRVPSRRARHGGRVPGVLQRGPAAAARAAAPARGRAAPPAT